MWVIKNDKIEVTVKTGRPDKLKTQNQGDNKTKSEKKARYVAGREEKKSGNGNGSHTPAHIHR